MKKNRIIGLICSFSLSALLLFSACGKNVPPAPEPPETPATVNGYEDIDFDTVLGNLSEYGIVVADGATKEEINAAAKLNDYTEKMIARKLGYSSDGEHSSSDKIISVGRTARLATSGIGIEDLNLGNDGFIIKNVGKSVYICGGGARGTVYGVYDMLEYFFGVKVITEDYTYIPVATDLPVYASDRVQIPAFEYRTYLDECIFTSRNTEFAVARRFTSEYLNLSEDVGGNIKWYSKVPQPHNSLIWANAEEVCLDGEGKVKPEYVHAFTNDGNSVLTAPEISLPYAIDLCFTDGIDEDGSIIKEVTVNGVTTKTAAGLVVDYMQQVIQNDADECTYYFFGQNDLSARPCQCERCIKASQKYTDSGIVVRFINAIADEIYKFKREANIEREIKVGTFAYQYSAVPPVKEDGNGGYVSIDETCKVSDNVITRIAPIGMDSAVPYDDVFQDRNKYGSDYLKKWKAIGKNFMAWTYVGDDRFYFMYRPTMQTWRRNLDLLRDMGVNYVFMQSNYCEKYIYQTILDSYVAAKMMWNPHYDLNFLVSEFNRYYLGEAGAKVADNFVANMAEAFATAIAEKSIFSTSSYYIVNNTALYTKGLIKGAMQAAYRAIEETKANPALSEEDKARFVDALEVFNFTPRYMYVYNYMSYEGDAVQMKVEEEKLISDILDKGGTNYGESATRCFNLENLEYHVN